MASLYDTTLQKSTSYIYVIVFSARLNSFQVDQVDRENVNRASTYTKLVHNRCVLCGVFNSNRAWCSSQSFALRAVGQFDVDRTALVPTRYSQCLNFKIDLIVKSVWTTSTLLSTFWPIEGLRAGAKAVWSTSNS